eukprot:Opistho-2@357
MPSVRVNIQLMQCGQKKWCDSSPCKPPMTGSPNTTSKPGVGMANDSENALALMRWQPVQWQAMASSGGAVIRRRTWPQRQPPVQGSCQSLAVSWGVWFWVLIECECFQAWSSG